VLSILVLTRRDTSGYVDINHEQTHRDTLSLDFLTVHNSLAAVLAQILGEVFRFSGCTASLSDLLLVGEAVPGSRGGPFSLFLTSAILSGRTSVFERSWRWVSWKDELEVL
jgi:hypothetical protein